MSSRKLSPSHARCRALVDFDGTIAPDDPTDRLFERFADPLWREIEDAWQTGQISSRECMARQVELLRATPAELDDEIGKVRIDPAFHSFLRFCWRHGVEAIVVSDGFDRVVRAVLEGAGIAIPFFANRLEWQGGDRWRLTFPHSQSDCRVSGANCKCSHGVGRAHTARRWRSATAGRTFAWRRAPISSSPRGRLPAFAAAADWRIKRSRDFDEATAHLARWLASDGVGAGASATSAV